MFVKCGVWSFALPEPTDPNRVDWIEWGVARGIQLRLFHIKRNRRSCPCVGRECLSIERLLVQSCSKTNGTFSQMKLENWPIAYDLYLGRGQRPRHAYKISLVWRMRGDVPPPKTAG